MVSRADLGVGHMDRSNDVTISYDYPRQPRLGRLVDGDLCDISVCTRSGRKKYCGRPAVREAFDVDGASRFLCADHTSLYFPHQR